MIYSCFEDCMFDQIQPLSAEALVARGRILLKGTTQDVVSLMHLKRQRYTGIYWYNIYI